MCFEPGLVVPVGGSLLKFVDFPMVKNILSLPQRLFGFHSTQKLRYRASRAKPFKLTCISFASLNLVQMWQIQSNIHYAYNMQKEYVTQFYKTINKLLCNLSFAGQYIIYHQRAAVLEWLTLELWSKRSGVRIHVSLLQRLGVSFFQAAI